VAQTYQFIATGNAELGFVALSQILRNGEITDGSAWIVPECLHAPILQDAVILPRAATKPAAAQLMSYMGAQAQPILRRFGYVDVAAEHNSC
jgi:molybdate transport system substrate-binding protein